MVKDGRGLVDVGTDHGNLPIFLAERGYPGRLFASDINPQPLESARRAAQCADLDERIEFLLCDGLDDCPPEAVDTIVVAGMGGDLICRILDRAEWCMSTDYTLILQPMTKAEILRFWLVNNGYTLTEERLVQEGFLYQVIKAEFTGNMALRDAELFSGAFQNIRSDPLAPELIETLLQRFEKENVGLMRAEIRNEGKLALNRAILAELEKMKGKLL